MKVIRSLLGFLFLITTFYVGVTLRDQLYERSIRENIRKIDVGMTESEVISILGRPTSQHISDVPGIYWCYGSDSWQDREEYCGSVALEMSRISDGRVVHVSPVLP